jgi:hypothetical protein
MVEQGTLWELYLDGQKRLAVGRGDPTQLPLDGVETTARPEDLARWLADELQHPSRNVARDVMPAHSARLCLGLREPPDAGPAPAAGSAGAPPVPVDATAGPAH